MATISTAVRNRDGRVIKVGVDGVNREVLEVWRAIRAGTETFDLQSPGGGTLAVDAVLENGFPVLGGAGGAGLASLPSSAEIRLLVMGDSIAWGLGLKPNDKISARVANRIAQSNPGSALRVRNFANSGARIGRESGARSGFSVVLEKIDDTTSQNLLGEAANRNVFVHDQVNAFLAQGRRPEQIDYILVSAGINDVGLGEILKETDRGAEIGSAVASLIGSGAAGDPLRDLGDRLVRVFPNARIILMGYFTILSERSVPRNIPELGLALGYLAGEPRPDLPVFVGNARENLLRNCHRFHNDSAAAINDTAAALDIPVTLAPGVIVRTGRVRSAIAEFAPRHALFGPKGQTALWRLDARTYSTDDTRGRRRAACTLSYDGDLREVCSKSAVGHPSPRGVGLYFNAIEVLL